MLETGDDEGAGQPGQTAAPKKARKRVRIGRDAEQAGTGRIGADRPQPQAEAGTARARGRPRSKRRPATRAPTQREPGVAKRGQPGFVPEGLGARGRGDPGPFPGADDQIGGEGLGDEAEADSAEDLVDPALDPQRAGQPSPDGPTDHSGQEQERDDDGAPPPAERATARGGDRPGDDLALDPDVPQTGRER